MQVRSLIPGARALALSLTLVAPFAAAATEVADFGAAKAQAASSGKPVLIDFSSPT